MNKIIVDLSFLIPKFKIMIECGVIVMEVTVLDYYFMTLLYCFERGHSRNDIQGY